MLPVVTILGRPNVGKSTLFNVLTKTRNALVADEPGVTRDRQYGEGKVGERSYIVVDTGGIEENDEHHLSALTVQQVQQAIEEADVLLFMVDAKSGLTAADQEIASQLRPYQNKVVLVVNKVDSDNAVSAASDFYSLGFKSLYAISANSRRGVETMMIEIGAQWLPLEQQLPIQQTGIIITFVGRPNVGKSTLINRILGEERVIVFDQPGTTRDSIFIPFERKGEHYTLVDTAGVRRRARVEDIIEKFSIIKTMQSIAQAHIVIMVIDAQNGIADQDLHLLGLILKQGKPFIILINKSDGLSQYDRAQVEAAVDRRLRFVSYAPLFYISAKEGMGMGKIFPTLQQIYQATQQDFATPVLTKILEQAVTDHQPPAVHGRRIRLRYAHLGGHNPLTFIIHGKQLDALPMSYRQYLASYYRKSFDLVGVPIHIEFKSDKNPYI